MSRRKLFLHDQPGPTPVLLNRCRFTGRSWSTPIATSGSLVEKTGITPATVNKALGHVEQLGIVRELTARRNDFTPTAAQSQRPSCRWPAFRK